MRPLSSILRRRRKGDALRISGWATFFWAEDCQAKVIAAGAFSEFLDSTPPYRQMYHAHELNLGSIGVWDYIAADSAGLYVSGVIRPDNELGGSTIQRVLLGDMRALSIGHNEYEIFETAGGALVTSRSELIEISICEEGAMPGAIITDYKWIKSPFSGDPEYAEI